MPLILKGKTKKVLTISTSLADDDWTTKYDIDWNAPYVISKAKDGVLFIAICPGAVDI
jgi:hypothetical protein